MICKFIHLHIYIIRAIIYLTLRGITMEYAIQQKIDKLSKMYNYFEGKKAIKIISSMTIEEAE